MNALKPFYFQALLLTSCLFVGCGSSALPPKLSKKEAARLSELPLPYTVGVERYIYPVYSDNLLNALKDSGIFREVAPISTMKRTPDFIARVEKQVHGTAVIPMLTIASAGLIPTVVNEDHGEVFSLSPRSRSGGKLWIDASYSGPTTIGWAAALVNLLPNFTYGKPEKSERFYQMLSYRILTAIHPERNADEQ